MGVLARRQIRLHPTRDHLNQSAALLPPVYPGQDSLSSAELGLRLGQSVFLHGYRLPHRLRGDLLLENTVSIARSRPSISPCWNAFRAVS
jgi:hypothetical protein